MAYVKRLIRMSSLLDKVKKISNKPLFENIGKNLIKQHALDRFYSNLTVKYKILTFQIKLKP